MERIEIPAGDAMDNDYLLDLIIDLKDRYNEIVYWINEREELEKERAEMVIQHALKNMNPTSLGQGVTVHETVKEKDLEPVVLSLIGKLEELGKHCGLTDAPWDKIAKLSNKHYLEVFEKCLKDNSLGCSNYPLNYIRKALEQA